MNDWKAEHELWAACQGLADEAKIDIEHAQKRYERMTIKAEAHREQMELLLGQTALLVPPAAEFPKE